ncbi:MAG: hypothetical protein PSV35_10185, partial [bacterium]|nr:hypothetical protein [bacterium]
FDLDSAFLALFNPYIGLVRDLLAEYIIDINKNPKKYLDRFLNEDIYEAIRCAKSATLILRQDHSWKHLNSPPGLQTMLLVAQRSIDHQQKSEEKQKHKLKQTMHLLAQRTNEYYQQKSDEKRNIKNQPPQNKLKLLIDCHFFSLDKRKYKSDSMLISAADEQMYHCESSRSRLKMRRYY